MSDIMDRALAILNEKVGEGFDGSARIDIAGQGSIVIDGSGVRVGEGETDVTLAADADTFRALLEGDLDPASAFMSGQLEVEGDMGQAMALGTALA